MVCACISLPLSDSQHHHFPLSPSPTTMPSMGAQAAGESLIGAHRRDQRSRSLLHFLPLPPLLLHSWPKSCGPISWPQYHSKENHNIEGDSYQETVVAETSNVSFGSPLRARARPRLPPLLSGRRRRSPLLTLKEASKRRLAAVTAGTKPFSLSEHGNRRRNVENVEGGHQCIGANLSFPNKNGGRILPMVLGMS